MNEYTPSTEQVRRVYKLAPANLVTGGKPNPTPEYAAKQFDRWLAVHDAQVIASVTPPPVTGDEREALAQVITLELFAHVPADEVTPFMYPESFRTADAILARFTATPKAAE